MIRVRFNIPLDRIQVIFDTIFFTNHLVDISNMIISNTKLIHNTQVHAKPIISQIWQLSLFLLLSLYDGNKAWITFARIFQFLSIKHNATFCTKPKMSRSSQRTVDIFQMAVSYAKLQVSKEYWTRFTEYLCAVVDNTMSVDSVQTQRPAHIRYRADDTSLVLTLTDGINPALAMIARRTSPSKRSGCLTTDVDVTTLRSPLIRAASIQKCHKMPHLITQK